MARREAVAPTPSEPLPIAPAPEPETTPEPAMIEAPVWEPETPAVVEAARPVWEPEAPVAEPETAPPAQLEAPSEPEATEAPADVPAEEKRSLFSRVWSRRDREAPVAPEPATVVPVIEDELLDDPLTPELIAFLEEPSAPEEDAKAPAEEVRFSEPVDESLDRDRETLVPEATPDSGAGSTAPFSFVHPTGTSSALFDVEAEEPVLGVVESGDRITEFGRKADSGLPSSGARRPPATDWLASRDEPSTVPLAAWIARPVETGMEPAPLAPELPLPAAEERPDEDWWPEEPSTPDASDSLRADEDWWSQPEPSSVRPSPVAAPEEDQLPLIADAPPPSLLPEPAVARSHTPWLAPDLIPVAETPVPPAPAGWDDGEDHIELFEEMGTSSAAGARAAARRRRQPAPRKAVARTRKKGRAWWPVILTIVAVLAILFGAIAVGARVGTAALWNAALPGEKAVAAPDEYSYVLPSWPVFGAAPAEAETAPPSASLLASASAGATEVPVPTDPVVEAALPYPDPPSVQPVVIRRLKPQHRYVAITLDDGIPFDTRLMDLFGRYDARATTFLLGQFASTRPELVDRLQKRGFEIANHSWDHKDLTKLSEKDLRAELSKTQSAISAVTGNQAPYLRPPGGEYDDQVVDVAASMGYRVVMWNRSIADTSQSATPEQLYHNAVDGLQAGDIILAHWGRPDTYAAMAMILPELKRRGFRAVTVSELIADSGGIGAVQ